MIIRYVLKLFMDVIVSKMLTARAYLVCVTLGFSCLSLVGCSAFLSASITWLDSDSISGKLADYSVESSGLHAASANSTLGCNSPKASIYKINDSGDRIEPSLATASFAADGSYTFLLKDLGFKATGAVALEPLIVVVSGCDSGVYSRAITGAKNQDVTMGSSLVAYLLNTSKKDKLATALKNYSSDLNTLYSLISSASTLSNAYANLTSDPVAIAKFNELFGTNPDLLEEAAPEVIAISIPTTALELAALPLSVSAKHWSSDYSTIYSWKLDGVSIGQSASFSYTPTGNSQGTKVLTLLVGQSDGSGGVDTTKPYKQISQNLIIANNVLPRAPNFSVTTPVVTGNEPINTRNLTLSIDTGAAQINCDSFSKLLVTENNSTKPQASDFGALTCSAPGSQTVSFSLASANDGAKTLRLWALDASGVVSDQSSDFTIYLDTGIPTVNIVTTPLALTNSTTQSFEFTGDDNGGTIARFECKLDGAAFAVCSTPISYSGLAQGPHTFSVKAIDSASNEATVATKTWNVDLTAPTLTLSGMPNSITNQLSSVFTFSAVDTGGGTIASYDCKINSGAWSSCASPFIQVMTAGSYNFFVRAVDTAGNISAVSSFAWVIDTSPPTVTISSKPLALTNSTTGIFSFSGTDTGGGAIAGYQCKLDAGSFAACNSGQTYSSLAAGAHTFEVKATDTAGNVGTSISYTWTVDLTTPLASINANPPSITNSTSAVFQFSANAPSGGSIVGYECSLNGAAFSSCTSPKTYAGLTQGAQTFSVQSVDNNNNRSNPVSYDWILDTSSPVLTIGTQPVVVSNQTSAGFTFSATDSGGGSVAGYECKLNGGSFASCSSPVNLTDLIQGSYSYQIRALDTAGNYSSIASINWVVDTTAPTIGITAKPNAITNLLTANFSFSGSDTGGAVLGNYECSLDGAAYVTCTSPKSYFSLTAGSHSFAVRVSDTAGNTSAAATYNWTVDITPPTLSITSTPLANTNQTTGTFSFTGSDSGGGSIDHFECKLDSGSYAVCASPQSYNSLTSISHTISIKAFDTAGNESTPGTYTWTIDTTPPTITITTPVADGTIVPVSQLTNFTVGGACSENTRTVQLAGASVATATCSGGSWSVSINVSALADGPLTLTATHTDLAGNSTTSSARNFIKDTTAPVISITTPVALKGNGAYGNFTWSLTENNIATSTNFTVDFYDGATWTTIGSKSAIAGANLNQAYSVSGLSLPNINTSSAKIRIAVVDAAGNSSTVQSGTFVVDSLPPTISSLIINDGASGAGSSLLTLKVAVADNLSATPMQVRFAETTDGGDCQSLYANTNWLNWTNASTSIGYSISPVDGKKKICVWAKDGVGNISVISPSTGTSGVDCNTIDYFVGNPPVVTSLTISNATAGANFGTQLYSPGDTVKISWQITDVEGLSSSPISILVSVNGGAWTSVVSNYGSLSGNPTSSTGSYSSYAAPTGIFRIKVVATDSNGNTSIPALSNIQNSPNWSIFMGAKETGIGGKGTSLSMNKATYGLSQNQFAVNPISGDIYAISFGTGIVKMDAKTGDTSLFLTDGSSNFSEGRNLTGLVGSTGWMSVNFDKAGRLYISNPEGGNNVSKVSVKIWQIDLSNNIMHLYVGGGTLPGIGSTLPTTGATAFVTLGAFEFDQSNNIYFFADCDASSWISGTNTFQYRILKATQNSNGTLGAFSFIAGDCSTGLPVNGADALSSNLGNAFYKNIRQIAVNSDGSRIYYSDSLSGSPASFKIVNVNGVSKIYSTPIGLRGIVFDQTNDALYAGSGTVYQVSQSADPTATESLITYVNSAGTGDCDSDGVLGASACINAYGSNGAAPLEIGADGKLLFTDTIFRIRYLDANLKLRTLMGTRPFFGDGLNRSLVRGTFRGMYYKTSNQNTTDFPKGLYFLDWQAGILGYVNPATDVVNIVAGNQQVTGSGPAAGTVVSPLTNMGVIDTQQRYNGLTFDSNGLPVFMGGAAKILRLDPGKTVNYLGGGGTSSDISLLWFNVADGTPLNTINITSWGNRNLVMSGTDYIFSLAHSNNTQQNPLLNSIISVFNFADAKEHILMRGSTLNSGQAISPDSSNPSTVQASPLGGACYAGGPCYLQFNSSDGKLYFSEGAQIRALTNPTNPAAVTLASPASLAMGRTVENFVFSPDQTRIYYLSGGALYCKYIGVSTTPTNCQNTSLGPTTGFSTLTSSANNLVFIQDGQLIIANGSEVYQYTYAP